MKKNKLCIIQKNHLHVIKINTVSSRITCHLNDWYSSYNSYTNTTDDWTITSGGTVYSCTIMVWDFDLNQSLILHFQVHSQKSGDHIQYSEFQWIVQVLHGDKKYTTIPNWNVIIITGTFCSTVHRNLSCFENLKQTFLQFKIILQWLIEWLII